MPAILVSAQEQPLPPIYKLTLSESFVRVIRVHRGPHNLSLVRGAGHDSPQMLLKTVDVVALHPDEEMTLSTATSGPAHVLSMVMKGSAQAKL